MKLFNEAGEEIKVYDKDKKDITEDVSKLKELTELQEMLKKAEEGTLTAEDKTELEEFREDGKAMNFRAMRKKIEGLTKELEKDGKKITDDGKIEEKSSNLTTEELLEKATEAGKTSALKQIFGSQIKKHLDLIEDKDKREVVSKYFDKLSAGEDLSEELINSTMKEAMNLSGVEQAEPALPIGSPPRPAPKKEGDYSETPEGKNLAEGMGLTIEEPKKEEEKKD